MPGKLIVTNRSELIAKYGTAGVKQIETAIQALINADASRGIQSQLVHLDDAGEMSAMNATAVTSAKDARQNKDAIDELFASEHPDYLMLLGSKDVIPFQDMTNPLYGQDGDVDAQAWGDLPYACEAPYGKSIQGFTGPTRVVGRLPDLTGGSDSSYLAGLLRAAAAHKPSAAGGDFGLSAEVWEVSTTMSVTALFGSASQLKISPPSGPAFTAAQLGATFHFVNCHGATVDPQFYGQRGTNYPVSMQSAKLSGLKTGSVAAFECCYGAELYNPAAAQGVMPIASRYLESEAAAVLASTTIAYGPADANAEADLLCQYFMNRVLTGASTGRAFLEARQDYIRAASVLTPFDLKTIAQFVLLGDPSLTPVSSSHAGPSTKSAASKRAFASADVERSQRRGKLAMVGAALGAITSAATTSTTTPATPRINKLFAAEAPKGVKLTKVRTFRVRHPKRAMTAGFTTAKAFAPAVEAIHVAIGIIDDRSLKTRQLVGLLGIESDGKVIVRKTLSR
jgi:hypothetical protein